MSATYNDGSLDYGSAVGTVTVAAADSPLTPASTFTVVFDSVFNPKKQNKRVEQTNKSGEPSAAFAIPTIYSGSDTVQLPAGKRIYPGDKFVVDATNFTSFTFYVTNADNPHEKEGYRKQTIEYHQKIN
jgi:hypothetical protein